MADFSSVLAPHVTAWDAESRDIQIRYHDASSVTESSSFKNTQKNQKSIHYLSFF